MLGFALTVLGQVDSVPTVNSIVVPTDKKLNAAQIDDLHRSLVAIHNNHPAEIDQAFERIGVNAHQLINAKSSARIWASIGVQQQVQRMIIQSILPRAIKNGVVLPSVNPSSVSIVDPLSTENQGLVVKLAASVGRLEVLSDDGSKVLQGTVFVIGIRTVATNCHVISDEDGRTITDLHKFTVDFSDGPNHLSKNEFDVVSIFPCSGRTGFDVAFLSVSGTSRDGTTPLPPPLPVIRTPISSPAPGQMNIWLIGYPNLQSADEPAYQRLEASAPNTYSEIFTPGLVQSISRIRAPDGNPTFDVILHIGT
ncbi:MAG TPA: trypsin-like peptidase domain-containing protein, partial [Terriglobales bacterium]